MGRKSRKGKSVINNLNRGAEPDTLVQAPHSFVIYKGDPSGSITTLTKDFRKVMEPFTASHLKERRKNTIRDFVAISGPLHVSHLSIFSQTDLGMYLKICRLPRGPSLTFKIQHFSLARDVISSLKRQQVVAEAFACSPLVVLNNFSGEDMHLKLMANMFQNMFPTINVAQVDLNTVRRCVLLNYNSGSKLIDFRHYNIKVTPVGVSRNVRKMIANSKIPNLSRCKDISEFFNMPTMSDSEPEDADGQVELPQQIKSRGNIEKTQSSIRLSELGPRLTLLLLKIEDGLLEGDVLYHNHVHKTEEEIFEIQKKREMKRKLKEKRKRIQEANRKSKENNKQKLKELSLKGMKKIDSSQTKDGDSPEVDEPEDDAKYYREEVGQEPDEALFKHKNDQNRKKFKLQKHKSIKRRLENGNSKKNAKRFKGADKTDAKNRDHRPVGGIFFRKRSKHSDT